MSFRVTPMPPTPGQQPERDADTADGQSLEKHRVADLPGGGPGGGQHAELFAPLADRDGEGVVNQGDGPYHDQRDKDARHAVEHGVEIVVAADTHIPQQGGMVPDGVLLFKPAHEIEHVFRAVQLVAVYSEFCFG